MIFTIGIDDNMRQVKLREFKYVPKAVLFVTFMVDFKMIQASAVIVETQGIASTNSKDLML